MPFLSSRHVQNFCWTVSLGLSIVCAPPAQALPTHFADRMEAMLACRSEWSTSFWRSYFYESLGKPIRVWGGAEWFDGQKATLGGNQIKEVFLNTSDASALMVGVLIEQPIDAVRKKLTEQMGLFFDPVPGAYPRFISKTGSVLVAVDSPGGDKPMTKWFCARWNLGNRP